MKLSDQEKRERRRRFLQMSFPEKADHIITYYKAHIVIIILTLIAIISCISGYLTSKTPILYAAEINVVFGDDSRKALYSDFPRKNGLDPRRNEIRVYSGLYLTASSGEETHSYSYASGIKIMGAIDAEKMDIVFMNREAYDILSGRGYLMELSGLIEGEPFSDRRTKPELVSNSVILSDNSLEIALDETISPGQKTTRAENAIRVNNCSLLKNEHPDGDIYLGVIANSPRIDKAADYILCLLNS